MMIHRYIGPLHYCIDGPDSLLAVLPVDDFSVPQADIPAEHRISVSLRRIPRIDCNGALIYSGLLCDIYIEDGQEYRVFYHEDHGVRHNCVRVSGNDQNLLIEYASLSGSFPLEADRFDNCLLPEKFLLRADACILHSSSILYRGRSILFTAPSGTGKSTQANLWRDQRDLTVMNGDRNIIGIHNGQCYSCGLPWHGTSPDCHNYSALLGAIVVIRQSKEDSIESLSLSDQFCCLYSELTVNSWNQDSVNRLLDLIPVFLSGVPVFRLNCTMQPSAVDTLEQYLSRYWS